MEENITVKELTPELVQKALQSDVRFFQTLTKNFIDMYNDFNRLYNKHSSALINSLNHISSVEQEACREIRKEASQIKSAMRDDADYFIKKMEEVKKVLDRKPRSAIKKAKADYMLDDE